MPLADVLSAMRCIILDQVRLPDAESTRTEFLARQFPRLDQDELKDLARIPPKKFHIYTKTIFRGEANNLETHFPVTLALLKKWWPVVRGGEYHGAQFVCDVQKLRPWLGYKTLQLCQSVVDYVSEELPDFVERAPELPEIARLEMRCLELKRERDWVPEQDQIGILSNDSLESYSVADLMNLDFVVPWSVRFEAFEFDVVVLREEFWAQRQALPATPLSKNPQGYLAIGARNPELFARWAPFPDFVWNYLSSLSQGEKVPLARLAEVVVENLEGVEKSEAEQFAEFSSVLMRLLSVGALILLSESSA